MARVFVSYSHEDHDTVARIIEGLGRTGHDVRLDENFLSIGDPLSTSIRNEISLSDFVCVVLSPSSEASTWVKHEIAEVLHQELERKRVQLLPCIIAPCELPAVLTRFRGERLHLDFEADFGGALRKLEDRVREGERPIFEREAYLRLDIPVGGLDLYLTGETWNWERNEDLRYFEMVDGYLLFGFKRVPWAYFKHFALCDEPDAARVRGVLESAGLIVTGVGDRDLSSGRRRVWFTLPNLPVDGQDKSNRWNPE